MRKKRFTAFALFCTALFLCACGPKGQGTVQSGGNEENAQSTAENPAGYAPDQAKTDIPDFAAMHWEQGMELSYATRFRVEKSEEYYLITIVDSDRFLLVPEGFPFPEGVPEEVTLLQKPLEKLYIASSSVFDLIRQTDALGNVRFSGTKSDSLYIPEVKAAMENGSILFAGKYSLPDYELLLSQGCDLAVENTMIYHNPTVKEKLESLGIPVWVEASSYEQHPLGRMEWIRLYGLLLDRQKEADDFFNATVEKLSPLLDREKTGCRVAFFYINTNGAVNVRKPGDYIAKMIDLAGGEYVITAKEEEENALSTMNMQMEDFYLAAKDADVIIYNSTITGTLDSVNELVEMNSLFEDFKAVREGRVYCTDKNFFQETTAIGDLLEDLCRVVRYEDKTQFHQLIRLE